MRWRRRARAQGLFSFFAPSPHDIARGLDQSGYALTRPLARRGDVYLADVVVAGRGDAERLVIDAQTGRIVQRYRVQPVRWRDTPREVNTDDGMWGPEPRPPADFNRPAPLRDEFAREENDPAYGTGAPRTTSSDLSDPIETPKPKPHEVKHKSAPVAKTPATRTEASAGAAATAPAATPASLEAAHPARSDAPASAAAPAASPTTVTAKTDAASTPPAAVKAPAPAPAEAANAKPAAKTKPVNDLPVTPLD